MNIFFANFCIHARKVIYCCLENARNSNSKMKEFFFWRLKVTSQKNPKPIAKNVKCWEPFEKFKLFSRFVLRKKIHYFLSYKSYMCFSYIKHKQKYLIWPSEVRKFCRNTFLKVFLRTACFIKPYRVPDYKCTWSR